MLQHPERNLMQIQRSDYITASKGDAVHAYGQCYTSAIGRGMIESVVHHAFDGNYYYTRQAYQRLSDDNGKTWRIHGPIGGVDPTVKRTREFTASRHFLDPTTGVLLGFFSDWLITSDEPQFASNTSSVSYRPHYRISRDGGLTWEPSRQIIHKGAEFDSVKWMPGITYGINGGYVESCPPLALADGTIVLGMVAAPLDAEGKLYLPRGAGYWYDTWFLLGKWNADRTELEWTGSHPLAVGPEISSVGLCEPDVIEVGDGRLFSTSRCQGRPGEFFSSRYCSSSVDGGATWTAPKPITYDDGGPVFVPAAFSVFLKSPRTGKIWWFMNILDHGVYAQYPRCPLVMVELDTERLCLIRSTQRVVQDLPPGASPCTSELPKNDEECGRQYTNFGSYVDRETGEMVIVVTEMPRTTWAEFTSDVILIRVRD